MTKVNSYDNIDDSMLKFAVIIARHNGKWVFCKHKERNTWEVNITLRQSRLSGVARATFPDKQSHLVINYCIMF